METLLKFLSFVRTTPTLLQKSFWEWMSPTRICVKCDKICNNSGERFECPFCHVPYYSSECYNNDIIPNGDHDYHCYWGGLGRDYN